MAVTPNSSVGILARANSLNQRRLSISQIPPPTTSIRMVSYCSAEKAEVK